MRFTIIQDLVEFTRIEGDVILIPILQDLAIHRKQSQISFIYVYDIAGNTEYIINLAHHDYVKTTNLHNIQNIFSGKAFVYNKAVLHNVIPAGIDINILLWTSTNNTLEIKYTTEILTYQSWYKQVPRIANIIPMMCWLIYCRNIKVQALSVIRNISVDNAVLFYNEFSDHLNLIEDAGIHVNPETYTRYTKNKPVEYIYSHYNLFTATGRPSNSHNAINFAALNKNTGIRDMINARTEDGMLIEFDYDSNHVRLASDLIGVDLPSGNLHEYFGRLYFRTPVISPENYAKSKNLTWQLMYGNMIPEYINIPYFKAIHEYKKKLWADYKRNRFITMPLSGRKLHIENADGRLSANLIFNYLMQGYEAEMNSLMLKEIFKYLYKRKSKLILYTYDSFLFDYNKDDGKSFLTDIGHILNQNNLKCSIKFGKSYGNMREYKN